MRNLQFLFICSLFIVTGIKAQVQTLRFSESQALTVTGLLFHAPKELSFTHGLPLFSLLIDSNHYQSSACRYALSQGRMRFTIADSIEGLVNQDTAFNPGLKYIIRFTNKGKRRHSIENLVPLGEGKDRIYITGSGTKEWPAYLCRSVLHRPGYGPVGVILPDNAWHLGFADYKVSEEMSLAGLARRTDRDKERTGIDRWAVTLKPDGWVEYALYFDVHEQDWHEGLRMMFQQRWLYDLPSFDNSLFERSDLQWMKNTYIMLLQFAWDRDFYNPAVKQYDYYQDLFKYSSLTGGYDIFTLWPTWPRLGLDQRNQWDMYRDLPGGLPELRKQVEFAHKNNKKYFISYNPWDESTRGEDQVRGMEDLLRATDADGVVLDTRGASSKELQAAADKVRPGIIMYSEGMAIPKDMPGIVSGRVHDALVLPPPLNLNKFIKPDFAIFRVLQLADDRLHRELAISFFNGYGVEINTMRPGRPSWIKEEYAYMGRTTKILRENNSVFHNYDWLPLLPTLADSIYVNRWTSGEKVVYTIYSNNPAGHKGALFELTDLPENRHMVDLWNHKEVERARVNDKYYVPVEIEPFERSFLNSRREGNAGCIGIFPELLNAVMDGGTLKFSGRKGDLIVLTGENPTYQSRQITFPVSGAAISYMDSFDATTEKIVVQLFDKNELLDERAFFLKNDVPVKVSIISKTPVSESIPENMVMIPAGDFRFCTRLSRDSQDPFIALPDHSDTVIVQMKSYYIDRYPVTNRQFREFLAATRYFPSDTTNFLKHWVRGAVPAGDEDHPVVYISREDAVAYAEWAKKRLPSEAEWQYAAQGTDMRKYPWGNQMDSTKCNFKLNHPVSVRSFPEGKSPFGVEDMIGNVWQLTNDVYSIGPYRYAIIKGGSYYHPTASIWYVTGGPLPADHPGMLLLMYPGLDRNATVGFRCVMDGE